jgi:alpha-ketoglutarate-dependent taurine dioxygenase
MGAVRETTKRRPTSRRASGLPQAPLAIRRQSGVMGAEITGVDLSKPVSPAVLSEIRHAFLDYHLLAFPGQNLGTDAIQALAGQFGEVEGHIVQRPDGSVLSAVHAVTNLDADGIPSRKPHINANYYWHSDKSYYRVTSLLTMLYAVELPPNGGETQFANMQMAYAALSDSMKRQIAGLRAENNFEYAMINSAKRLNEEEIRAAPPVDHPIVRTHPETGRKSLFIGMYAKRILGMPDAEGQALLKELLDHATQPSFTFSHEWHVGDLVMWDNRCLNHRAVANYQMTEFRRVLLRCVVKGSVPF